MVTTAMKLKDACFLEESYDQTRQHIKKQRYYFANKDPSSQSCLKKQWQPILVFLPAESQGRRSLVGCHLWGRTELDFPASSVLAREGAGCGSVGDEIGRAHV